MFRKKIIVSVIVSGLLLTSCASTSGPENAEGGEGTQAEATGIGALFGAGVAVVDSLLKGKKPSWKKIATGAAVGALAGYVIGGELAEMQKGYKGKEKELIAKILEVNEESKELATKNDKLVSELSDIENKISSLEEAKSLGTKDKAKQKSKLRAKLRANKNSLEMLVSKNRKLSENLANSKSKASTYTYDPADREQIMSDIGKKHKNSKKYESNLNSKIASIDTLLNDLA